MAYYNQDKKRVIEPTIKALLKKYGLKGSLSVKDYSTVRLTIRSGKIDFKSLCNYEDLNECYIQVNQYRITESFNGIAAKALTELYNVLNTGNYNRSDIMTDYFDVGFYVDLHIGEWNKPYIYID